MAALGGGRSSRAECGFNSLSGIVNLPWGGLNLPWSRFIRAEGSFDLPRCAGQASRDSFHLQIPERRQVLLVARASGPQ